MSKVQRNLERWEDELVDDANLYGFKLESDPIINARSRRITLSGEIEGLGEGFVLAEFNRKGKKLDKVTYSIQYDDVNARFLQEETYSNYRKFEKASSGSHKKRYEAINDLISSYDTLQEAVDLFERMPGVSDVNIFLNNYDTGVNTNWM